MRSCIACDLANECARVSHDAIVIVIATRTIRNAAIAHHPCALDLFRVIDSTGCLGLLFGAASDAKIFAARVRSPARDDAANDLLRSYRAASIKPA
ncbi:MAG TPA: hypothetical protein VN728_04690 [Stellaceae bacterium]|jgi:hypothetical protein|nr:hypothetical protein [Stellaceae bacterium]